MFTKPGISWGATTTLPPSSLARAAADSASSIQKSTFHADSPAPAISTATTSRGTGCSGSPQLGEHRFRARVAGGKLDIVRGAAEHPDANIATDPATLAAVLWHGHPMNDGAIDIRGDRHAAVRFLSLFPAPEPATG